MGRRSPYRAGLLNGSSSISSAITIVRVALIGKQTRGLHILRCPVFLRKRARKGLHSTRLQISCFVLKVSVKQCRSENF